MMGARLKAARDAAGVTQTAWAARLGVMQPAVSNWESGRHEPPLDVFRAYSKHLRVSLDYLLTGHESTDPDAYFVGFRAGLAMARNAIDNVVVDPDAGETP
jgi:transcriptional regulator with XRE-family HTH domain